MFKDTFLNEMNYIKPDVIVWGKKDLMHINEWTVGAL